MKWLSWLKRKKKDEQSIANQQVQADDAVYAMRKVNIDDAFKSSEDPELAALAPVDEEHDPSEDFTTNFPTRPSLASPWTTSTRSSSRQSLESNNEPGISRFPLISLRSGRYKLNPIVMKALVHCQSTYKASDNDIKSIVVDFMNMVCGQKWEKEAIFDPEIKSDEDSETEDEESGGRKRSMEPSLFENVEPKKKKRRVQSDLTYRFPSRPTRRKYLRYGALLNLKYVAKKILNKKDSEVITYGFDDATKAAGFRLFDVKTDHITINSAEMNRETFTTGFTPNLSHSGQDQTTTVKFKLQTLAVLAGEGTSLDDILENIDF